MSVSYTQSDFENMCRSVHGSKYDYSKVNYKGMNKEIEVICKKHGSFSLKARDHYHQKHGCSECYIEDVREDNLKSHEDQILKKFEGKITIVDRTGFTKLRDTLTFNCFEHGDYKSKVASVKNSPVGNCPSCKTRNAGLAFIQKSKKLHKGKYTYNINDYVSSRTPMEIYCTIHKKSFTQRPSAHAQGQGCPICGDIDRKATSTKDQEVFISECKALYGEKYDYTKTIYTLAHNKVIVTCPEHGDFSIAPNNHLHGLGCKVCSKNEYTYNPDKFIKESQRLYPNRLDYTKTVFVDRFTEVILRCKDHDYEYRIKPAQHLGDVSGSVGCKHCGLLNMGRWNIQSVRQIPYVMEKQGYLYLGKISGLCGVKIGVTENIKDRLCSYNTDLKSVVNNFNYIDYFYTDYISAYTIEYILKRLFSKYKVKHNINFGGKNEVFDLPPKELNFVHKIINGDYDLLVNYLKQEFVTTRQDYTEIENIMTRLIGECK